MSDERRSPLGSLNVENGAGLLADRRDVTRHPPGVDPAPSLRPRHGARSDVGGDVDARRHDDRRTGGAEQRDVVSGREAGQASQRQLDLRAVEHSGLAQEQAVCRRRGEAADGDQHLRQRGRHFETVAAVHVPPGRRQVFAIDGGERAGVLVAEMQVETVPARDRRRRRS